MATARSGGRGKPRPFVRPLKQDPALLAYVRERLEAGKRVGREEPMRLFGCTREAVDKARATVLADIGRTVEDKIDEAYALVADREVWEGLQKRRAADAKDRNDRRLEFINEDLKAKERRIRVARQAAEKAKDPYSSVLKAELDLNAAAQNIRLFGKFMDRDPLWADNASVLLKALDDVESAVADFKAAHVLPPDDPSVIDVESWEDPGRALD